MTSENEMLKRSKYEQIREKWEQRICEWMCACVCGREINRKRMRRSKRIFNKLPIPEYLKKPNCRQMCNISI